MGATVSMGRPFWTRKRAHDGMVLLPHAQRGHPGTRNEAGRLVREAACGRAKRILRVSEASISQVRAASHTQAGQAVRVLPSSHGYLATLVPFGAVCRKRQENRDDQGGHAASS